MNREACLWGGRIEIDVTGAIPVPNGPGLGYEPDPSGIERYRVA
jgi:hypothetical protein